MLYFLKNILFIVIMLIIIGLTSLISQAESLDHFSDEHIAWQRVPIHITLPVGKERFVSFPDQVQFGYNKNLLSSSMLRVQNDHRTLYLLAKKPFNTQRTEAKLSNGEVILLDIEAKQQADNHPINIILPEQHSASNNHHHANTANINYVILTRYAIQQLYSPKRLLKSSKVITRFSMGTTHVVPLFQDGSVLVMPLASWRGRDLYVTALLVKNLLKQSLRLNPR